MQRRAAQGLENVPARLARNGPHADGRIGRAECGGADRRNIGIQRFSKRRQTVDIAQLALICGHAQRGIALGMLHGRETFLRGQLDVRDFHVVLEIQP